MTRVASRVRCHPQTVLRRTAVFVRLRRHGQFVTVKRIKVERVVVAPHVIAQASQTVAFGHASTVSGWLGTSTGQALAGHVIRVLAAPDDGLNAFAPAATAVTGADGSWTARLPAGPSRIVEAVYAGDPVSEGASSGQVHVIVPARVRLLRITPQHVRWGGTVRITGQLLGGYLPARGALVRLRIGIGRSYQTYGVQRVGRQRTIHHDLHVRRRSRLGAPRLLLPGGDVAVRGLPVCAWRLRASDGDRGRRVRE